MNGTTFIQFQPSGKREAHISYGANDEVRDRLMLGREYETRVVSTADGLVFFHMLTEEAGAGSWPNSWHHDFMVGKLEPTDDFYTWAPRGVVVAEYDFSR